MLGGRLNNFDYRVYVLLGDGECEAGQIWEAAMAAAHFKCDRLTAILDYNKFQQTGSVQDVMPTLEPIVDKWAAFGWDVRELNGHIMEEIVEQLNNVQKISERPQMIVAHTLKGKGLSPFVKNDKNRKHGKALTPEEMDQALKELEERKFVKIYTAPEYTPELTVSDKYGEVKT